MKFKRIFTKIACDILNQNRVKLKPALSRARNKFLNVCAEEYTQFENDKNEIIMQYVSKDENGNPIWSKDEHGNEIQAIQLSDLSDSVRKDFIKDMNELIDEDFIFEENESNKPIIDALRLILRDLDIVFKNDDEAFFYDQFCDLINVSLEDSIKNEIENHKFVR